MKQKRSLKASTQLAPVPAVLLSCAEAGGQRPNLVTVAWAGTINSDPPMLSVSLRRSRYSHQIIQRSGEFAVNLVSQQLLRATDYCGVVSGRDVDKFAACELTPVPLAGLVHAPAIAESPLVLGCQVRQVIELGSHDLFLAEIVSVEAAESLFDQKGALRLERADLVAYAHGHYYALGRELGFFGYSVARKEVLHKRMKQRRTEQRTEQHHADQERTEQKHTKQRTGQKNTKQQRTEQERTGPRGRDRKFRQKDRGNQPSSK